MNLAIDPAIPVLALYPTDNSSKNLKRSVPRTMHCGTNCNTKIIEIPSHTRACKKIGGINKLWFLQTMEYCAALTRNEEYLCIPVGN